MMLIFSHLHGLGLALKGQRSAAMPKGWESVESKLSASPNAEVRAQAQSLSLTFGSVSALTRLEEDPDGQIRRPGCP